MTEPLDYNRDCRGASLDRPRLHDSLLRAGLDEAAAAQVDGLFASVSVLVPAAQLDEMRAVVRDVEAVVKLPAFEQHVLATAPPIARLAPGNHGVLFGYDFHLGGAHPQIIEINSNAGGALLNVFLARAQGQGCAEVELDLAPPGLATLEQTLVEMFQREWRAARPGGETLRTIAIVDDAPASQFLYSEFVAFAHLFEQHGLRAVIADPGELTFAGSTLSHRGERVDLVYNRLTDFYLDAPAHAALRDAYLAGSVVLTPHPRAHALLAHKRNLVRFTNDGLLSSLGVPPELRQRLLHVIPTTIIVDKQDAEALWRERKRWFFKPGSGYGSKAAYRGEKLTKGTFAELIERDYVAQALVPPSERTVDLPSGPTQLKLDVRAFTYAGEVLLFASRLYRGQTTNFRTEGGGFAPVFALNSPRR